MCFFPVNDDISHILKGYIWQQKNFSSHMKEQLYYVKTSFKYGFYGFSFQSLLKSAILDMHTVFSLLGPPGGLFFSGPFKGGGGLFERAAYLFLDKII